MTIGYPNRGAGKSVTPTPPGSQQSGPRGLAKLLARLISMVKGK